MSFIGPSYNLASRPASVQRTVNFIPVPIEPGNERTAWRFKDAPGERVYLTASFGETRQMTTLNGVLYFVAGNLLYREADNIIGAEVVGYLGTSTGPVEMAQSTTQLAISDGHQLYVYTLGDPIGSTEAITVVGTYTPGYRIGFLDEHLVFFERDTKRFRWSEAGDAATINELNFATVGGDADNIVSLAVDHRELWFFKADSTEIWNSVGGEDVFSRNNSAFIEFGCAAERSVVKAANSLFWIGRNQQGQGVILQASGYQPQRVSTAVIEERMQGIDLTDAYAFSYSDGTSIFVVFQVPEVDTSLVYDVTFKQWHERGELVDGEWTPWAATCAVLAHGKNLVANENNICELDHRFSRLDSSIAGGARDLVRDRIAPVFNDPMHKVLSFPLVELLCENETAATVMLRYSDDNGKTWASWRQASTGSLGAHKARIRWLRCGSGRDRVFHLRCSDAQPLNPIEMRVEVR